MCGICGVVDIGGTRGKPFDAADMYGRLKGKLAHRGPDDHGWYVWGENATAAAGGLERSPHGECSLLLMHDRLAIIDLSTAARQPMRTPDGRYTIVYNGEIYNYIELREELESVGVPFVSQSDTEVFLRAYAAWGPGCAARFTGMFAAVIFDAVTRELVFFRDVFGIKPFYYAFDAERQRFAFASEIKALLALPFVPAVANVQCVYDFLMYGFTDHTPGTAFKDVFQLPPAHTMRVDMRTGRCEAPVRYWNPAGESPVPSFVEAAERLRDLFVDSVRLHLRSDVPVGSCLSGGIDSTAIVMAMRRLSGDSADIRSFSFVPEDERIGEARWIDLAVVSARTVGRTVTPSAAEFMEDIEHLVYIQDEPFQSRSIYAQYRVMKLAAENGVKVMLDGQGADELFAGYRSYYAARLATLIRGGQMSEALRLWTAAGRLPGAMRGECLALLTSLLMPERLGALQRRLLNGLAMARWTNRKWFADRGVQPLTAWASKEREVLKEKLADMLDRNSLPRLLHWEDRNSMAFSIESRVPFLTPRLAAFARSLPEDYLISRDGTSKAVLRQALRGLVPDAILDRKDKIGFLAPEREWALGSAAWANALLNDCGSDVLPFVNHPQLLAAWSAYRGGRGGGDFRMWQWLSLCAWVRRFDVRFL